jgi:peptidoglycan/xylan/chitin deacetylase (PgdA/CDA1 family)
MKTEKPLSTFSCQPSTGAEQALPAKQPEPSDITNHSSGVLPMHRILFFATVLLFLAPFRTCASPSGRNAPSSQVSATTADPSYSQLKKRLADRYGDEVPHQWGEAVTGVKRRLTTTDKVIALTMDACGSGRGMGYDSRLIGFLEQERVPATLFINARWIGPNRAAFDHLATTPLFEIANHGLLHRPASVNGKSAYGIGGTHNIGELVDEIELNARKLEELTGRRPRFYRSGTAYYDEVAVKIAGELGEQVAGFSLLGDAGATYSRDQVREALLAARPGDIIIVHMNHPESGTGQGVMDAVPELRRRGFRFVRLSDLPLE